MATRKPIRPLTPAEEAARLLAPFFGGRDLGPAPEFAAPDPERPTPDDTWVFRMAERPTGPDLSAELFEYIGPGFGEAVH